MAFSVCVGAEDDCVLAVVSPGDFSSQTSNGDRFAREYVQVEQFGSLTLDQMPVAATVVEDQHLLVLDAQGLHRVEGGVGGGAVYCVLLGHGPRSSGSGVVDHVAGVERWRTSDGLVTRGGNQH